jgi:hypothetical protein
MNNIISSAINLFHLLIVLAVIIIPFTNSPYFLLLHSVFVPFLILHWVTNNNTCVLTTTEKFFRGVKTKEEEAECFTCKLINPMFDFTKDYKKFSRMTYIVTIGLWLLSTSKLTYKIKTGSIKNIRDLTRI